MRRLRVGTALWLLVVLAVPSTVTGAAPPVVPLPASHIVLPQGSEADLQAAITLEQGGVGQSDSLGSYWASEFGAVSDQPFHDSSSWSPYVTGDSVAGACPQTPQMAADNASFCPLDDSIAYDLDFLRSEYQVFGKAAPLTVLAHEYGHHVQSLAGASLISKRRELQADCYAGMYLRHLDEVGVLSSDDITNGLRLVYKLGDHPGSSGAWTDPEVHGPRNQRHLALGMGYSTGDAAYCLAFNKWSDQPAVQLLAGDELLVAPDSDPLVHTDGSVEFTMPSASVHVWVVPGQTGAASGQLASDVEQRYAPDAVVSGIREGWLETYGWGTGDGATGDVERRDASGALLDAGQAALQVDPSGQAQLYVSVADDPAGADPHRAAQEALLALMWGYCDPAAVDTRNCADTTQVAPPAQPTLPPITQPAPRPPTRREVEAVLLQQMAAQGVPNCVPFRSSGTYDPRTYGALGSVDCDNPSYEAAYYLFPNQVLLDAYYTDRYQNLDPPVYSGRGCWDGTRGETSWAHGRIACWVSQTPGPEYHHAEIRWTDDRGDLYGILKANDNDLRALFSLWLSLFG